MPTFHVYDGSGQKVEEIVGANLNALKAACEKYDKASSVFQGTGHTLSGQTKCTAEHSACHLAGLPVSAQIHLHAVCRSPETGRHLHACRSSLNMVTLFNHYLSKCVTPTCTVLPQVQGELLRRHQARLLLQTKLQLA